MPATLPARDPNDPGVQAETLPRLWHFSRSSIDFGGEVSPYTMRRAEGWIPDEKATSQERVGHRIWFWWSLFWAGVGIGIAVYHLLLLIATPQGLQNVAGFLVFVGLLIFGNLRILTWLNS